MKESKKRNEYEFLVTFAKYKNSKITDVKSVYVTIKTNYKRETSMKYAIIEAKSKLPKNTDSNPNSWWQYFSIN